LTDKARRKELTASYRQARPEAGVYLIRNNRTGRVLLGSTTNLASLRNKLEFARSTGSPGTLDLRLGRDIREFGLEAFSLEVVDVLEMRPGMTDADIASDLATLEGLWRDKLDPSLLY
jgi:hypothetical protein